jgi:hypothetical protein
LGKRAERAAVTEETLRSRDGYVGNTELRHVELRSIISEIKALLERIDRDAPFIQLAITSSGESLSTSIPSGISPSRFLQASALVILGDTQFAQDPTRPVQIGPSFTLSLYMLFQGHCEVNSVNSQPGHRPANSIDNSPLGFGDGERRPIWKEVLHKCRLRLCRTPLDWEFDHEYGYRPILPTGQIGSGANRTASFLGPLNEFAYYLEIVEDLDDGRVHDDEAITAPPYEDLLNAGIRESIPIYQISKIFYADTGRILNIGNSNDFENNPVLLLKRDMNAPSPVNLFDDDLEVDEEDSVELASSESSLADQVVLDRQLLAESSPPEGNTPLIEVARHSWRLKLSSDLDPEWMALEVFMDDDQDSSSEDEEDSNQVKISGEEDDNLVVSKSRKKQRPSLDSKLISQIRNISIRSSPGPGSQNNTRPPSSEKSNDELASPEVFVARGPFGNIASSLSLLEMLIRLTSLQQYQQAAHLSIPDHILNFFLEETSSTGLRGDERWKVRSETKRRVGFDPYTDDN